MYCQNYLLKKNQTIAIYTCKNNIESGKDRQKNKLIWNGMQPRIRFKILWDTKKKVGLAVPNVYKKESRVSSSKCKLSYQVAGLAKIAIGLKPQKNNKTWISRPGRSLTQLFMDLEINLNDHNTRKDSYN